MSRDTTGSRFSALRLGWTRRQHERDEVRRFTRRSRNRRNGWLFAGGLVLFVALFVAGAVFSPLMAVRDIRISGIERLDATAVQEALADLDGRPIAQVGKADIAERLQPFVLIQSWSLQVIPPSTIHVEIVERVPIGVVPAGSAVTVVDAAGVELWQEPAAPADLPVLESGGISGAGFPAAAAVSLALTPEFRQQVATITAASMDDVKLALRDGTQVVWGSAEHSPHKAEVLAALVAATGGAASHYDVSSPDNPITRQ